MGIVFIVVVVKCNHSIATETLLLILKPLPSIQPGWLALHHRAIFAKLPVTHRKIVELIGANVISGPIRFRVLQKDSLKATHLQVLSCCERPWGWDSDCLFICLLIQHKH